VSDERREGFNELKEALGAVVHDVRKAGDEARENRQKLISVQEAIAAHDKKTALTGQNVTLVMEGQSRIEDKIDTLSEVVTETRVHGEDTRAGLTATRDEVAHISRLVAVHNDKLEGGGASYTLYGILAGAAVLVWTGYHFDKEAMDATVAALKGLF
jgi:hypothetical protein